MRVATAIVAIDERERGQVYGPEKEYKVDSRVRAVVWFETF